MRKHAVLSHCGAYRYLLRRAWDEDEDLPGVLFIMLNPSTADAEIDDPTVRRCVGFAKAWGCGNIAVVNLFAFRATKPSAMLENGYQSAVGPENDAHIRQNSKSYREPGDYIVAAWGANGSDNRVKWRVDEVLKMLSLGELYALGFTNSGEPRHPLYCRADMTPVLWTQERGEKKAADPMTRKEPDGN
jgi:hypothetical protein